MKSISISNTNTSPFDPKDFRTFDTNGDGYINYESEFFPHLHSMLKAYAGKDEYISNGKGTQIGLDRLSKLAMLIPSPNGMIPSAAGMTVSAKIAALGAEKGADELAEFQKSGWPLDTSILMNESGGAGYSFDIDATYPDSYCSYLWKLAGGKDPLGFFDEMPPPLSLKDAASQPNNWMAVSSGDRQLLADGRWERFAKADTINRADAASDIDRGHYYSGTLNAVELEAYIRSLGVKVSPKGEEMPTAEALQAFYRDTGRQISDTYPDGTIIAAADGSWKPAEHSSLRQVAEAVLKESGKEELSFRELMGYH